MISQAFWHFHCPECGFGDADHGHLLDTHEIYRGESRDALPLLYV
jgi:hypothetical protein